MQWLTPTASVDGRADVSHERASVMRRLTAMAARRARSTSGSFAVTGVAFCPCLCAPGVPCLSPRSIIQQEHSTRVRSVRYLHALASPMFKEALANPLVLSFSS